MGRKQVAKAFAFFVFQFFGISIFAAAFPDVQTPLEPGVGTVLVTQQKELTATDGTVIPFVISYYYSKVSKTQFGAMGKIASVDRSAYRIVILLQSPNDKYPNFYSVTMGQEKTGGPIVNHEEHDQQRLYIPSIRRLSEVRGANTLESGSSYFKIEFVLPNGSRAEWTGADFFKETLPFPEMITRLHEGRIASVSDTVLLEAFTSLCFDPTNDDAEYFAHLILDEAKKRNVLITFIERTISELRQRSIKDSVLDQIELSVQDLEFDRSNSRLMKSIDRFKEIRRSPKVRYQDWHEFEVVPIKYEGKMSVTDGSEIDFEITYGYVGKFMNSRLFWRVIHPKVKILQPKEGPPIQGSLHVQFGEESGAMSAINEKGLQAYSFSRDNFYRNKNKKVSLQIRANLVDGRRAYFVTDNFFTDTIPSNHILNSEYKKRNIEGASANALIEGFREICFDEQNDEAELYSKLIIDESIRRNFFREILNITIEKTRNSHETIKMRVLTQLIEASGKLALETNDADLLRKRDILIRYAAAQNARDGQSVRRYQSFGGRIERIVSAVVRFCRRPE